MSAASTSHAGGPPQDLVDIARGRPARSGVAVDGSACAEVDLGGRYPVHVVVVPGDWTDPAADLTVTLSQDGLAWVPAAEAFRHVGPSETAMFVAVGEGAWARHVRVTGRGPIQAVQVRCDAAALDLMDLRASLDLAVVLLHERPGAGAYVSYSFQSAPGARSHALVGLAPVANGAFGNCLLQYFIAVSVAKALNLKYIKLPRDDRSKVIDLKTRMTADGITFVPAEDPLPPDGSFLTGLYFDPNQFHRLINLHGEPDARQFVERVLRHLFNRLPETYPPKPDDALLIHIRSGDIFSTWVDPHYPQPPLAFYRMVIDRLVAEGRIRSVRLVFENRLNPVIAEVEAYVRALGLPLSTQSESLVADVAALVDGRYLVFGLGTFGPAICHLSKHVEQVFYFASGSPQGFQSIQTIGKVVEVVDRGDGYIKVGQWQNTEAQRRMMLDYPIENLAFDDVP